MVTVQRDSGEIVIRFPIESRFFQTRLRWLPDSRSAAIGMDVPLKRYDMTTGQQRGVITADRTPGYVFELDAVAGLLAYKAGNEILLRDLSVGRERVLLQASAGAGQRMPGLSVSPDGRQLAVARRHADETYSIDLVENNGTSFRSVATWRHAIVVGPWTRDGRYLLFSRILDRANDRSEIVVLDATTGSTRALPIVMAQIQQLRLHPDGRRLAFVTGPSGLELALLTGTAAR